MMSPETQNDWRALLYALSLRNQKPPLAVDEIAYLVAERYPHTAPRLQDLISGKALAVRPALEKRDQFGRLVGHEKAKAAGA